MELELRRVPYYATSWEVKHAFGAVLHGPHFFNASDPKARQINFAVKLNEGLGIQNNGTGTLILPDRKVGQKLVKLSRSNELTVQCRDEQILFRISSNRPPKYVTATLEKTPYLPPDIEEERETIIEKLSHRLAIDKIQFGVFYRDQNDSPDASRRFSNEYELTRKDKYAAGFLAIEYDHKLIRLKLGDPLKEDIAYHVVIKFDIIRRLATGTDWGMPFICFELLTPPIFQAEGFHRTLSGNEYRDEQKFRQRLQCLNPSHSAVSPYAHQLRVILLEDKAKMQFVQLCQTAKIKIPINTHMHVEPKGFYSQRGIHDFKKRMHKFSWAVAFQIEALLRNGLVNTSDLQNMLFAKIEQLCADRPKSAADTLRQFTDVLRTRDARKPILQCYEEVMALDPPDPPKLRAGLFKCHHVTVTPSRMVLEGPFSIQSNRVIREYEGYEENFIRVDFRDEDRLQYRWERGTDGASLLVERVGGLLKHGFELAGRRFEFLAYSSSALREHAVWFLHPFQHHTGAYVTADYIRSSLGNFEKVIHQPSKYAARMAQAFSATDSSVKISRDQWEEMNDLGEKPYLFTDGVGTISKELRSLIWDALCAERDESYRKNVEPSAYQIRFLGFKGMVCVDPLLKGIKMRLRKSMNKFEGPSTDYANIEIARAFERPNYCFLNRPLIMVLEDRGVHKATFLKLQKSAIEKVHTSSDSILDARKLLREQQLGGAYRVPFILQCLHALNIGLETERTLHTLRDPFFERLFQYAKNHVLRDIKHAARIPIPNSHLLVGVADEGPAYEAEGVQNIFKLAAGQIYACVQGPDDPEPIYLKGLATISRSPVVHPGDVQRVVAIGKPPEGQLCLFAELKNCVVLPCVGEWQGEHYVTRSLASQLGGGDLDGDSYSVIMDPELLPTEHHEPADYPDVETLTLNRASTVDDICDFVVEYINSDLLGLLSDKHLIIADQSKYGTLDEKCMHLAKLCSQAVDYAKNGNRIDISNCPRWLIPYKPDWKKPEEDTPFKTDYYESDRALGELFRGVKLIPISTDPQQTGGIQAQQQTHPQRRPHAPPLAPPPLSDPISTALKPHIAKMLGPTAWCNTDSGLESVHKSFRQYVDELRYISLAHALSESPASRLVEEEVVLGTILAHCSQPRFRTDRMHRMRLHAQTLVNTVRYKMYEARREPSEGDLRFGLIQAWRAWDFAMRNRATARGASSFALIALGVILDILQVAGYLLAQGGMQNGGAEDDGDDDE